MYMYMYAKSTSAQCDWTGMSVACWQMTLLVMPEDDNLFSDPELHMWVHKVFVLPEGLPVAKVSWMLFA